MPIPRITIRYTDNWKFMYTEYNINTNDNNEISIIGNVQKFPHTYEMSSTQE